MNWTMMAMPPSLLSLAAVGLYCLVSCACAVAALSVQRARQPAWHRVIWLVIGAMFVMLAFSRLTGFEEALRESLRLELRVTHQYEERRSLQRPIAAFAVALVGAIGLALAYRTAQRLKGPANLAAITAVASAIAMVGLVCLRLISLSPVDKLLYGPLKLNWIADIGLSTIVLVAAALHARLGRREPRSRSRSSRR
ncbi:MAG: hypothetical protein KatS3mg120_0982 [Erythrobacter sp.]|jgi:MFS family permease|nr:MAG: hypothetical protein KatS3mg120_0982 [Erythrobacter sp.]